MEADWDNRARRNAAYFVATENKQWDTEAFFDTGKKAGHDQVLGDMGNMCGDWLPADMRVLEIGCGIGRLTRSLAEVFGEVHAVDISGEVIERAGGILLPIGTSNSIVTTVGTFGIYETRSSISRFRI